MPAMPVYTTPGPRPNPLSSGLQALGNDIRARQQFQRQKELQRQQAELRSKLAIEAEQRAVKRVAATTQYQQLMKLIARAVPIEKQQEAVRTLTQWYIMVTGSAASPTDVINDLGQKAIGRQPIGQQSPLTAATEQANANRARRQELQLEAQDRVDTGGNPLTRFYGMVDKNLLARQPSEFDMASYKSLLKELDTAISDYTYYISSEGADPKSAQASALRARMNDLKLQINQYRKQFGSFSPANPLVQQSGAEGGQEGVQGTTGGTDYFNGHLKIQDLPFWREGGWGGNKLVWEAEGKPRVVKDADVPGLMRVLIARVPDPQDKKDLQKLLDSGRIDLMRQALWDVASGQKE